MVTDLCCNKTFAIEYGKTEIYFRLNFKNRKTLAIHVYPDSSVVVDAPNDTPLDKVKMKVIKRAKWIKKQQRNFERYPPVLPARKYTTGEAFRYLGRQYPLKVERGIINKVKLLRGQLLVSTTYLNQRHIKELVDAWYREKAIKTFNNRFIECLAIFSKKTGINHDGKFQLRTMKTRWGSCSKYQKITLNPELIGSHKECIDYVITHELCHLAEHNHSKKFYKTLEAVMPDWEKRKDKLETTMEHRSL